MPNVNLTPVPTDGYPSVATDVMAQLYAPATVPNSLEVMNGWLDKDNKKSTWIVDRGQVRSGSMTGGKMVGLTGNIDYLDEIFPLANTEPGAYIPISGCGQSFRLPYAASVVIFTWQLVAANDSPFLSSKDNVTELKMFIDGVEAPGQFRAVPDSTDTSPGAATPPTSFRRYKERERIWSGHWTRMLGTGTSVLDPGWHSAHVSIFNLAPAARVRIRNFKYMYWR